MSFIDEPKHYLYELEVARELFYNEKSMWGVFSFVFVDDKDRRESGVEIHPRYNTFVISGDAPQMKKGEKRHVAFIDHMDDKYGKGYRFTEVKSSGLKTSEAQAEFVRQMVNGSYAEAIIETYPPNETYLKDLVGGKYDLTIIHGIKEKKQKQIIESLEKFEEYQEAIVMLSPIGAGISSIKRLVEHFYNAEELVKVLENNVYKITAVDGFGFRKVDDLALKLGYSKDSTERLVAGAEYVLEQMSAQGDIRIPIDDFDEEMCKILEISEVTDSLFEAILNDDRFTYSKGEICLEKLRREEVVLAEKITLLLNNMEPDESLLQNKDKIILKNEKENGFEFNEKQKEAIENTLENGVSLLTGGAGTGKTASVKTIVDIYRSAGYNPVAMALSGKAAQVMINNGVENAGTIHRMLGYNPKQGFAFNSENPLPNKLVILDEATMVNNTLFKNVIDAIRIGDRILFVGDSAQLPPIGHGALFDTLLKINIPKVHLTEIHRQAAKSGIITAAAEVRNGKQLNEYGSSETQIIGELKDMRVFNYIDKTSIYNDVMTTAKRFLENPNMNPEDLQVITAMKRGALGVPELNKGLQQIMNPHPSPNNKLKFFLVKGQEIRVGDRVIQNGNLYKAEGYKTMQGFKDGEPSSETNVYNGTIGYVVEHTPFGLLVKFDTYLGTEYVFYQSEGSSGKKPIGMLELAYAITVHRSQGSGFKTVLFTFDYSAYMLLSKEFVYTGITRAIDNCLMFVENTALHHAIKKTHSGNRRTYLFEYLTELLKTN